MIIMLNVHSRYLNLFLWVLKHAYFQMLFQIFSSVFNTLRMWNCNTSWSISLSGYGTKSERFKIEQGKRSNKYVLCINTLSFVSIPSPLVYFITVKNKLDLRAAICRYLSCVITGGVKSQFVYHVVFMKCALLILNA